MNEVGRRNIILAIVGAGPSSGFEAELGGITRLQKLLFLLEKEEGVHPQNADFDFVPYKKGPYSDRLYDDLELLENLGLLESEPSAEATPDEAVEIDLLTFDGLVGDSGISGSANDEMAAPDAYQERRYRLTMKGKERAEILASEAPGESVVAAIRRVKSKYAGLSLTDLLRYVYTKYPEMTTESDIRDRILRK